jgi:hypothetical protein
MSVSVDNVADSRCNPDRDPAKETCDAITPGHPDLFPIRTWLAAVRGRYRQTTGP